MASFVKLITENTSKFPEFVYHLKLFKKARRNKKTHPDICIEVCKALLEGVSKSIIERLDLSATREELDNLVVMPLVKQALTLLKYYDNVLEDDFVKRSVSFTQGVAELRNARGDISHGKATPKRIESTEAFASMVLQNAESLLTYMLASFFAIQEEHELAKFNVDNSLDISYEENPDFNNQLDELNPLEGKPLYSLALYQQYLEDYVVQLEIFKESQEEPNQ